MLDEHEVGFEFGVIKELNIVPKLLERLGKVFDIGALRVGLFKARGDVVYDLTYPQAQGKEGLFSLDFLLFFFDIILHPFEDHGGVRLVFVTATGLEALIELPWNHDRHALDISFIHRGARSP